MLLRWPCTGLGGDSLASRPPARGARIPGYGVHIAPAVVPRPGFVVGGLAVIGELAPASEPAVMSRRNLSAVSALGAQKSGTGTSPAVRLKEPAA
jgi:hypothetical protein